MELKEVNLKLVRDLQKILRKDQISVTDPDRLSYGRDSCSQSILWARGGQVKYPPDIIVWPETTQEVSKIAALASSRSTPLIPFGGGSGVCGGTWALHGGIALDLKRMNQILKVDPSKMTVTVQSGINGEIFERELQRRNMTLGHFPSSIYVATVGGYLACRSAGQLSTKYGKIEDMVEGLEVVLADGKIVSIESVRDQPQQLDLKEIFVGSEGTLGIITETTLKIHQMPESEQFLAFQFHNLEAGLEAIRELLQRGVSPAIVRLYDELDTLLFGSHKEKSKFGVKGSLKNYLKPMLERVKNESLKIYLKHTEKLGKFLNYLPGSCMLILGFQGFKKIVQAEAAIAEEISSKHQAVNLGEGPGLYWKKHRYSVSYKLSPIFDAGFFADTMEVATTWKNLSNLYHSVREAISKHALVLAHFSHAYPEGCSIYFTFVGYEENLKKSEDLYQYIWREALEACVGSGGTISHHHGVGVLKAGYMKDEWGEGLNWLKRVKNQLDPEHILNPGKLGLTPVN